MNSQFGGGWIELICGSMFSGKTEELLRRVRRSEIARRRIQLFKPQIDNRYGRELLASHNGVSRGDVTILEDTASLLNRVKRGTEVVAIDEVQFFNPAVAGICQELADQGETGDSSGPGPRISGVSRSGRCRC